MPPTVTKIGSLDSIRGIAAFVVMLSHFMNVFFPAVVFGPEHQQHTRFDLLFYQTPLAFLFAGNFAVAIFFILSGFVLTLRFFSGKQSSLFPAAFKRYFRLMPIVFVSIMMGFVIMSLHQMHFAGVPPLSGSTYAGSFFGFPPDLFNALAQGLYGSFIIIGQSGSSYNPVLWTIHYEFLASFLIFGLASLALNQPKRWILYIIAYIAFANTYFCFFIVGLALADVYANRETWFDKIRSVPVIYKWAALIFALGVAGFPIFGKVAVFGDYWRMMILFEDNIFLSRVLLQTIAGAIVIVLALSWQKMSEILHHKIFLWLGKVSYALYAVHFIFIFSVSTWIMLRLEHLIPYKFAAIAAIVISIPAILGLAYLLHKYVELPSIALANKVGEWSKR